MVLIRPSQTNLCTTRNGGHFFPPFLRIGQISCRGIVGSRVSEAHRVATPQAPLRRLFRHEIIECEGAVVSRGCEPVPSYRACAWCRGGESRVLIRAVGGPVRWCGGWCYRGTYSPRTRSSRLASAVFAEPSTWWVVGPSGLPRLTVFDGRTRHGGCAHRSLTPAGWDTRQTY